MGKNGFDVYLYSKKVAYILILFCSRSGGINSINLPKITKIRIKAIKDFKTIQTGIKWHERARL